MTRVYLRIRIALMALAFGLAGVYMWNGILIGTSEIPVDLPKIDSRDEVLFIFPSTTRDASPYYIPKEGEIVDGRDLTLYDEGGYVESCDQVDEKEWSNCLRKREAARRFVYDHWAEKRRGYIQIGHPCVDCSPVDHIFIEPVPNGEMRIVITLETNGPLRTREGVRVRFRRANEKEKLRTNSSMILVYIDQKGNETDFF